MSEEKEIKNDKNIKFLRVIADMKPHSQIIPLKVIIDDEREFVIDKIIDIKKFVESVTNSLCFAYYCKFKTKLRILYLNKENNWFVVTN